MSIELGIFSSIKNNAVFLFGSFQKCLDAVTVSDQCDESREAERAAGGAACSFCIFYYYIVVVNLVTYILLSRSVRV